MIKTKHSKTCGEPISASQSHVLTVLSSAAVLALLLAGGCTKPLPEQVISAPKVVGSKLTFSEESPEIRSLAIFTVEQSSGSTNQERFSVSSKAITSKGDRHFLFVESTRGEYDRREVQVASTSGTNAVITAGLEKGDKVVIEGGDSLEAIYQGSISK